VGPYVLKIRERGEEGYLRGEGHREPVSERKEEAWSLEGWRWKT